MKRTVVFTHEAARQIDALAPEVRGLIDMKLDLLALNPAALAN
jgi:hypothetical protein